MNRRTLLLAASAAALAGCGFRLRGTGSQYTLAFQAVHIPGADSHGVAADLARLLAAGAGTRVVNNAAEAQAIVDILSEARDRSTITLNTQGRIREYTLSYRVRFRVRGQGGRELLAPTELALRRDLSYNESQAIAKEREEEMLFRDMQADAAQQILRRLAALK